MKTLLKSKKKSFFKLLFSLGIIILFTGCISLVKGEYYLNTQKYSKGIQVFKQEIKNKPNIAENHFYLGRFLLAQKEYKAANIHLKKSTELSPNKAGYQFWLGLSYAGLKKYKSEKKSYITAIELDPKHYKAYTYLGHNLFQAKKYTKALKSYDKALSIWSDNPSALYNRAMILKKIKRTTDAKIAFKHYIKTYASSPRNVYAATYLNQLGDFEYRVQLMGKRKIIVRKIEFEPTKNELKPESLPSLKKIGHFLKKNQNLVLHIIVYQKSNKLLAKQKAFAIKKYLKQYFSSIKPEQIKLSWFNTPENLKYGKKRYTIDDSTFFFATLKENG